MNFMLERVPPRHRPALDYWIATTGRATVARSLQLLATHLLYHQPQGKVFGLSAPELQILAQELFPPILHS